MLRTDAPLCDRHGRWISGKEATDVRLDVGDTMKKWNARRKCGPHRTLHSPSRPPTAHPLPPPTRDGVAQSHRATRTQNPDDAAAQRATQCTFGSARQRPQHSAQVLASLWPPD
jgi:hypothetical protein